MIAVQSHQRRQILEQSERLAGGRRLPEGARLSGDLHRPESRCMATGIMWTHIPHGVEDETGDQPLVEAARWLRARLALRRPVERPLLARLGGRLPGGCDLGLHPSDHRIHQRLIG